MGLFLLAECFMGRERFFEGGGEVRYFQGD